jgi:hypothetical protein
MAAESSSGARPQCHPIGDWQTTLGDLQSKCIMHSSLLTRSGALLLCCAAATAAPLPPIVEMPAADLADKIRGGLLGQMLGNLNGLPHEMRYIAEPGAVTNYSPALPQGAWTDDDTDFEWVYVVEMQRQNALLLSQAQIARLWKDRINRRIWCANQYARQLMDLGLEPPLTGHVLLNPWSEFNISGQFLCETFGLIAPAMPQTAARIGLNYTRVAIDGEPAQTTQLFTTMIASAFVTDNLDHLLDAGIAALDPGSAVRDIVRKVRIWHRESPADWRAARLNIRDAYTHHGGGMRDRNGYELNTAATIAALLYGGGDFIQTLQHAFNFGWDCDNSAATAGTILGVRQGYRSMLAAGWPIVDRYRNETRQEMPMDETITGFADRLVELAERAILAQDGQRLSIQGRPVFRIRTETPQNVAPLPHLDSSEPALAKELRPTIRAGLKPAAAREDLARSAYLAICLGQPDDYRRESPGTWSLAIAALQNCTNVMQVLFHHSPVPAGEGLRKRFVSAGIQPPKEPSDLWQ